MSKALTTAKASSNALATPITYRHHHLVRDLNPAWGIGRGEDAMPPQDLVLPAPAVLEAMRAELDEALLPCTIEEAARSAQYLIAAYPQQDKTSAAYVEQVTVRLAECPPDMLPRVLNRIIDEATDFRPAPGKVKQAVQHEVAKRRLLQMRVEGALRAQRRRAEEAAALAEIAAEKARRVRVPDLAMPKGDGSARAIPQVVAQAPKPVGRPVKPEVQAALRAALSQKQKR